jgi:hypothetical protein
LSALCVQSLQFFLAIAFTQAQQAPQKPTEKSTANAATPGEPQNPAQFELLETKFRFEVNGDSRKEVHARVHINSELGVRQFARLNFDYNRSFQSIDIPLVHITHPTGGTADILPSAITDNPNPAVVNAPAYQDVRVKSVRILGLEPGDNLEYRVITTTTHHPLAPDFWLDHSFDRTGVVTKEQFDVDVPAQLFEKAPLQTSPAKSESPSALIPDRGTDSYMGPQLYVSPETQETSKEHTGADELARLTYKWELKPADLAKPVSKLGSPELSKPDVILTTFGWWPRMAMKLKLLLSPYGSPSPATKLPDKYAQIVSERRKDENLDETLYRYVSQKIRTVDLPLGATGFRIRPPTDVLSSGYGTAEDKVALLLALLPGMLPPRHFALCFAGGSPERDLPRPSLFTRILAVVDKANGAAFLDPASEVAPFAAVPSSLRGTTVLMLNSPDRGYLTMHDPHLWREVPIELPFASRQRVDIDGSLSVDGKLTAKVHYALRGDNELLLRIGFHQTPKDKWKELAQLLSLSDGFRGQVTSVTASDPYATREPFTVDYEITQPKFVDWSKKPIRMPALLPQLGLPDPPAKPAPGAATAPIELGTPLEVETKMTLRLPPGTDVAAPTGTSVQRDYATFASQYSIKGLTITASRHINFLLRQVPADRAADYNAFLRAVLSDQAQDFTLDREPAPATAPPSTPKP